MCLVVLRELLEAFWRETRKIAISLGEGASVAEENIDDKMESDEAEWIPLEFLGIQLHFRPPWSLGNRILRHF